jgi:ribosomal protein L11
MRFLHGPRHRDRIMEDIKEAVRIGYFDEDRSENKLRNTPVGQLLKDVAMMSRRERKSYLARLGNIRTGDSMMLTDSKESENKKNRWLSR